VAHRLFGDPDTTDNLDGSWDHEFASGGDGLPSYTLEVGMPKVPAFFVHAGVKLTSIALEFTRSGPAAATISAIAQGETRFGTTQGGTPTSLTFSRISQFQGSIKRDSHQRSRRHGLRVMPPGPPWGYTRIIHRSLLRLIPGSVDECDGRMTFLLSLGAPGEDRDSVGAETER
jgi:hypothetical protein